MSVSSVNSTGSVNQTTAYGSTKSNSSKVSTEKKADDTAVVYEKSKEQKPATYSINKMSEEDRANLVKQLKEDAAARQKSLVDIAMNMMTGQATANGIANNDPDAVWKFLAKGDFTVDAATKKQAQADIAEDGYWGVKQTSQRLFDFASALAGDDVDQMKKMQDAMLKGFKQATKAWGQDLPQISQDTLAAANQLFEDYYASKG